MCWSKGDPESQQQTAASRKMDKIKCPIGYDGCTEPRHVKEYCHNGGICCLKLDKKTPFCVCPISHKGDYCEDSVLEESRLIMERTKAIAAFSAVLGAFVIIMFIVLIVLQIKYYKLRRKRNMMNDHEMDVIPRPPGGGSKINQPGYSWRESVRRTSKVCQKLHGLSSRSVPDDLFKMGVKIALFNWKSFEQKNEGRGAGRIGGGGEGEGAGGGGKEGGGGGNMVGFDLKTTHSPAVKDNGQEKVALTRTEDTDDK